MKRHASRDTDTEHPEPAGLADDLREMDASRGTALFMLPVQSGQTRAALQLLAELDAGHWTENAVEPATGAVTAITWFLSVQPATTYLIAQINGTEPARGFWELVTNGREGSRELRARLAEIGGVELDVQLIERLTHAPLTYSHAPEATLGDSERS